MTPVEEFLLNVLDGIVAQSPQYWVLEPRSANVVEKRTSYALPVLETFSPTDANLIAIAVNEISKELEVESRFSGKKLRLVAIKVGGAFVHPVTKELSVSIHLEFNK